MCYIEKGKVEGFVISGETFATESVIKDFKQNTIFGEYEFFSGKVPENYYRTTEFTSIWFINHQKFIELLKNFPKDYVKSND